MFKEINVKQGSDEWFQARLGKPTASIFNKVITKTGKKSSGIKELINRAVAELAIGEPDETFQSASMLRGTELEDQALEFFNFTYGYEFEKCGFLVSKYGYGCSPDGINFKIKQGLELKCPEAHTHIGYITGGILPDKYLQQVQGSMLVTGYESWIFGSYHPSLPCFQVEVKRDDKYIEAMKDILIGVCSEISNKFKSFKELNK